MFRRILIRLYPRTWRRRYGDEFALLLDATPMTPTVVANVLGAAAREWLLRTLVGRYALGMSVAWVANVIAGYLTDTLPMKPYIEFVGMRWAPWPLYFGIATPLLVFGVLFRHHAVAKRDGVPVAGPEFGYWVAAFLAAGIGSQWGDMVSDPELGRFAVWKSDAIMVTMSLVMLLAASKRPVAASPAAAAAPK